MPISENVEHDVERTNLTSVVQFDHLSGIPSQMGLSKNLLSKDRGLVEQSANLLGWGRSNMQFGKLKPEILWELGHSGLA